MIQNSTLTREGSKLKHASDRTSQFSEVIKHTKIHNLNNHDRSHINVGNKDLDESVSIADQPVKDISKIHDLTGLISNHNDLTNLNDITDLNNATGLEKLSNSLDS